MNSATGNYAIRDLKLRKYSRKNGRGGGRRKRDRERERDRGRERERESCVNIAKWAE